MREVIIGHRASDHIAIRVLKRENPHATDYWDGNWVDADVSIVLRPWQGTYQANLRTNEFANFSQELESLDDRSSWVATFSPMEPWRELALQLDSLGHIRLKGQAGPEGFGRVFGQTRLVFEADDFMDQTFIPPIIQQLQLIEQEFPVVGKPSD
jgi:hypothetical protein